MTDQERAQAITKSCRCVPAYTSRQLIDLTCAFHAYADEIADAFAAVRQEELERLNVPEVIDFVKAVNLEAAHQRERWGLEHDTEKTDADWFWLVGYLAGKALHFPEKRLHHLITTAAALANWHFYTVEQYKGEWAGPLEPPKEPQ